MRESKWPNGRMFNERTVSMTVRDSAMVQKRDPIMVFQIQDSSKASIQRTPACPMCFRIFSACRMFTPMNYRVHSEAGKSGT